MASFQEASTDVNALGTIPEDRPSNEWMPRNISLQRWWDVMTVRSPRSSGGSSHGTNSSTGGGNGATTVSIPSDEAELHLRSSSEGASIAIDCARPTTGAPSASAGRQRCFSRSNAYVSLFVLVLVLVAGVGVGIYFIVNSIEEDNKPTKGKMPSSDLPPIMPSSPPTYTFDFGIQSVEDKEEIEILLESISGDALLNTSSPQSMARDWLLNEDPAQISVRVDGEERVKQRYALSVMFFSFRDGIDGFLAQSNECDWTGVTCNEGGLDVGINLTGLGLHGSLPREIGELSLLEQLVISDNAITGHIPLELWGLPFLYILDLSENELSGGVSSFLWDLPFLEFLYLNSNNLTGALPDLSDSAPPLKHIWLHENSLTGTIPSSLSHLIDLETFVAYNNRFSSMLELQWSQMTKLFYIDVSWNQLSGALPDGMYEATSLQFLYMNNNTMYGPLDETLGELHQLQELWLQSNRFTGQIPEQWSEMKDLSTLLVYNNAINGTVPESICNLTTTGSLKVFETDCMDGNSSDIYVNCSCCTTCH